MNRLRVATEAEIEAIRDTSDLDAGCIVGALDTQVGTAKAVFRSCVEVDPVYYTEQMSPKVRLLFMRDIETYLLGKGVPYYYFNIQATETEYIETMKKSFDAEQVSPVPMLRFKKVI